MVRVAYTPNMSLVSMLWAAFLWFLILHRDMSTNSEFHNSKITDSTKIWSNAALAGDTLLNSFKEDIKSINIVLCTEKSAKSLEFCLESILYVAKMAQEKELKIAIQRYSIQLSSKNNRCYRSFPPWSRLTTLQAGYIIWSVSYSKLNDAKTQSVPIRIKGPN